jgi:PAS domain S-box-containing protein
MSAPSAEDIRVLHVDDDEEIRELVALQLERQRENLSVVTESSADDGLARLADDDVDCVVSDHDMPEKDGLDFLRDVRERYPELPFVLFTGKGSEEIASDAISAGVTEYLQKGVGTDQYTVLANRIECAVSAYRAEQALAESQRRLSTLISNLSGFVYRCRNERGWPMEFVSDGARDLTGYDAAAIETGEVSWSEDVVHEADREAVWERVQTAIDADEPFEVSYRIETADGERRWMWERGQAVDSEAGTDVIEGFITDITARKERERELEQYRTLVESVGDPMYVTDANRRIEMVNEAMASRLRYDREEILGEPVAKFAADESVERAEELIEELRAADGPAWTTFEMQTITADGTHRDNEDMIAVLTDDDGSFQGTVGVIRDISDRKQRERELERYETIIQAVGDPVYTLDDEGVFTFVNDAMESLSGYDRDELVGAHISKVMTGEDVTAGNETVRELLRDEDAANATLEMDVVTTDGECIPSENHIALLPLDDDEFRGTAGVVRDITERKERERRLEEFASVVSHDLRNPLNVVQGRVQLALESGSVDNLEAALDAAHRMERLIDDLLRLARQDRDLDRAEPVAVAAVATDSWDHLITDGATLTVESTRTVEADPDRLGALFENLFRNAIQHGADEDRNDSITVQVGDTEDGFYVADDGVGIDPDRRDEIFEREYTTSEGGTGFGLAIVESIAAAHDWSIAATEPADGSGARFEISV